MPSQSRPRTDRSCRIDSVYPVGNQHQANDAVATETIGHQRVIGARSGVGTTRHIPCIGLAFLYAVYLQYGIYVHYIERQDHCAVTTELPESMTVNAFFGIGLSGEGIPVAAADSRIDIGIRIILHGQYQTVVDTVRHAVNCHLDLLILTLIGVAFATPVVEITGADSYALFIEDHTAVHHYVDDTVATSGRGVNELLTARFVKLPAAVISGEGSELYHFRFAVYRIHGQRQVIDTVSTRSGRIVIVHMMRTYTQVRQFFVVPSECIAFTDGYFLFIVINRTVHGQVQTVDVVASGRGILLFVLVGAGLRQYRIFLYAIQYIAPCVRFTTVKRSIRDIELRR